MTRSHITLLVSVILAIIPVQHLTASELPSLVARSFELMEATLIDDWTYTVTSDDPDGRMVERHVASKPPMSRWQLLEKDGAGPTARDLDRYAKIQAKRERERIERENRGDNVLASMIEPGSLSLVSENDSQAVYAFRMNASHAKAGKFADHLRGRLVIDKRVPYVERATLESFENIHPATGVNIDEFAMALRFERHEPTGAIVPKSIRTRIKGRAFLIKSIDEDSTVLFSDFAGPIDLRYTSDRQTSRSSGETTSE